MKNIKSIIIGATLALISILFLNYGLSIFLQLITISNIYVNSLLLILPIVLNILIMELSLLFLRQSKQDVSRYSAIVFLIILIGNFILVTFYGMIELVISININSIWGRIVELWQIQGNEIYVLVAFVLLIVLTYVPTVQKRLMQYIIVNKVE